MKKILITGMNSLQCKKDHFLNQQLKVVPSHYSVIRCLEDMGYEVEQRIVELGEDISGYDDVIIYMHSPQSFCQNLYTGLYAASVRPDAILAFDDWQVNQIQGSMRGMLACFKEDNDNAFRDYLLDLQNIKYSVEELNKYRSSYIEGSEIMLSNSNRLLISAFAGGDVSLLNLGWKEDRVYTFNPNPYHYNRTPENNFLSGKVSIFGEYVEPENKKKEWNFASLVQKKTKKWLDSHEITWKINMYGQKSGPDKNERVTEDKMCRIYTEQWGCLMPGYFHAGSGWWRARPLQVADAESILLCDDKEAAVYGEAYVGLKAGDVEKMDTDQLSALAKAQRECLYDNHPLDKEVTKKELSMILEAAR